MTDIVDAQLEMIDRKIYELTKQREERYDFLVRPERTRIREIYKEIAILVSELKSLGDKPLTPTDVLTGYGDETEIVHYPISFEGKYFTFDDGVIEEK